MLHKSAAFTLPAPVRILDVQEDNYRTKTFVLDTALDADPGQFVMAWLPRFDEKPFSLVNADPVTLMITAVGPFSRLVHGLQAGDRLWIRGPFGRGFTVPAQQQRLALVGGGYGVAPLLWLARRQAHRAVSVRVIIGAGAARDILYGDRFERLATFRPPHPTAYTVDLVTEDGSLGTQGLVTDVLAPLLVNDEIDGIYACGPHGMLYALEQLGQLHNVPCQLSWEAYMRCAIGICGACEHEGRVLCLDGPVLSAERGVGSAE